MRYAELVPGDRVSPRYPEPGLSTRMTGTVKHSGCGCVSVEIDSTGEILRKPSDFWRKIVTAKYERKG